MLDDSKICPYTGLRPFSEEESLYFKGRDENIEQATRQLEKNKFLILTGASGDGKSSLVFAGVIPNARAGFLKSKFSNWAVADFRPERSPFKNLCQSIAGQLSISSIDTVEAELSRGFSALVDLYKASSLWYDESEATWQHATSQEQSTIKRKAANLLILADQFEEFFTNPENYNKGVPSQEAALVTNLLLETARISLEEKLPVYVVITMRSDFIGQCAAFRGLPEYIGFSQFFVPRLNRKQLQEVIEEPAMLSGNSISRRLTERLIEDLTEGTDQLPILQHALNQVWKKASERDEEMDLIHYAMVGGMDSKELPESDRIRFDQWFNSLPQKIRNCYDSYGLHNVLNTHANIINNQIGDYIAQKYNYTIADEDGKLIVKAAFKCLTKINQGRAVRNRMTLEEITQILDHPDVDLQKVTHILNIYRDPGNTLLKPFLTDVHDLHPESVLDITHESLIRNWKQLEEWANEEFDNYNIFLDFRQQLERWMESNKSGDFLLSIGPLTYFENWFNNANPNQFWMARYEADNEKNEGKLKRSIDLLQNAKEFLRRSARKHFATRTIVRVGPKKISLALIGIIFLTATSFMVNNYIQQQNSVVRKFMVEESLRYNNETQVQQAQKVAAIVQQLRIGDVTAQLVMSHMKSFKDKVDLAIQVATFSIIEVHAAHDEQIFDFLISTDSLLEEAVAKLTPQTEIEFILQKNNDIMGLLELANYYTNNDTLKNLLQRNSQREALLVKYLLQNKPGSFKKTDELNGALEFALNHMMFSNEDIEMILHILSPFTQVPDAWIRDHYSANDLFITGNTNNGFKFKGLYQELAYLYAALGDQKHVQQCMDSILKHNEHYPDKKYKENSNNAFNIACYFFLYNHLNELDGFIQDYCWKDEISVIDFYERLLARSEVYVSSISKLDNVLSPFSNKNHNSNLDFSSGRMISFFSEKLRQAIAGSSNTSSFKNYKTALAFKNEGIFLSKRLEDAGISANNNQINQLFEEAFLSYERIDSSFLNVIVPSVASALPVDINVPRNYFFLYPDFRIPFYPYSFGNFSYRTSRFLNYIIDSGRFFSLYQKSQDFLPIEEWISAQNYQITTRVSNGNKIEYETLEKLDEMLSKSPGSGSLDFDLLYLTLGNDAAERDDEKKAREYYHKIDPVKIKKYLWGQATGGVFYFQDCRVLRMVAIAVCELTRYGDEDFAYKLVKSFENPINRSSIYAFAAHTMILEGYNKGALVDQLIDSSYQEMHRVHNVDDQPNRVSLASALVLRNQPHDIEEAYKVIKNVKFKQVGIWMICRALAYNDQFYKAYKNIPENLSNDDIMGYFYEIYAYYKGNEGQSDFWKKMENVDFIIDDRIFYIP